MKHTVEVKRKERERAEKVVLPQKVVLGRICVLESIYIFKGIYDYIGGASPQLWRIRDTHL
jgi:hypothetical protein